MRFLTESEEKIVIVNATIFQKKVNPNDNRINNFELKQNNTIKNHTFTKKDPISFPKNCILDIYHERNLELEFDHLFQKTSIESIKSSLQNSISP